MSGDNPSYRLLTFVFTDIEGSTRLWEDFPDTMGLNIARHDDLLKEAIRLAGGQYVKGTGDGILAAFSEPASALRACIAAQHRFASTQWDAIPGIKVRMAIHFGDAEPRDGDYFGPTLNRLARLLAIGHGGQILASETYTNVLNRLPEGVQLRPMGPHRLKDLGTPMTVFQVDSPGRPTEFPPLKSLSLARTTLPTSLLAFL
ncbi:MAG: adenylate/guanylate cyclase domain-containing protein, partial [Nitrospirae bacterium]|nr:adenylate/guanylate cyclase domain-containing protein [Fimbriimonadaceae bacterium]